MARTVGVALVGTGFALHTQLPVLRLVPGAEVRALVGRDAERATELGRLHGIPFATNRLDAVLERADIDLVCIATPTDLHRPQALAALAAGKHVLCEKPLALDRHEAAAMTAAARAAGKLAVVDHQLRFAPSFRKLRRLVHEGYIGVPLHARVTMLIARWIDPRRPHSWWQERGRGGGVLAALGSHGVDWLRWMFGEVDAVNGFLHTFIGERTRPGDLRPTRVDSDDYAAAWLRLGGGRPVQAELQLSVVAHRGPGVRFEVYGSEGSLLCDDETRLWGSRRDAPGAADAPPLEELTEPEGFSAAVLKSLPDSPWARGFAQLAGPLVAAVSEGRSSLDGAASFADGLATQAVLDAIRASCAAGTWLPVD